MNSFENRGRRGSAARGLGVANGRRVFSTTLFSRLPEVFRHPDARFSRHPDARGFSLLEVLVATSVLGVALAALAQLFAVAIHLNARARSMTFAVLLAEQKVEELVADAGLGPSPAGALARNTAGYCDYVDRNGHSLGRDLTPPPGAVYLRRWSIEALPVRPDTAFVLQVLATRSHVTDAASDVMRRPDTIRLVTVRTRVTS